MRVRRCTAVGIAAVLMATGTSSPSDAAGPAWVAQSQTRLNELGCSSGRPDGVLDTRTRAAVVRFQSANRLAQTGRFDEATRARLRADVARSCDDRPTPPRSGQGRRIVVSQGQNWVWIVSTDGQVRSQEGMIDEDWLARRTYHSGSQCGRPARSVRNTDYSGRLWLHYFVRFAPCGVGFHQIPVNRSSGRQVHADWYVGTDYRESHGCIRLTRRMAREVWRFTVRRTKVVVVG